VKSTTGSDLDRAKTNPDFNTETILDLTQLSTVEKLKLKVSVISGSSYLLHSSTIIFIGVPIKCETK
jgi:hypothetical protein